MSAIGLVEVKAQAKSAEKLQIATVSRLGFSLFISLILLIGLLGGLVLNTLLSHGQFEISQLRVELTAAADYQEVLAQEVAKLESPENLKVRAIELGMVPGPGVGFVDLRDGRIIAPGIDEQYREADFSVVSEGTQ